jgi:hypothetical protein
MPYYQPKLEKFLEGVNESNVKYYKWKDTNSIRFLPPWSPKGDIVKEVWVHYGVGLDQKQVNCPRKMLGSPCPICEEADKLLRKGYTFKDDAVKRYLPKVKFLANIIDGDNPDAGVLVLSFPSTVRDSLAQFLRDPNYGDFTHPDNGYLIRIIRTMKNPGDIRTTMYSVYPAARYPLPDKSILDQLYDLDALVAVEDYKTIKSYMTIGLQPEEDAEEDPTEVPFGANVEPEEEDVPSCFGSFSAKDERCMDCSVRKKCVKTMIQV